MKSKYKYVCDRRLLDLVLLGSEIDPNTRRTCFFFFFWLLRVEQHNGDLGCALFPALGKGRTFCALGTLTECFRFMLLLVHSVVFDLITLASILHSLKKLNNPATNEIKQY